MQAVQIEDMSESISFVHATLDSRTIFSGGTGEASQETLRLHFKRVTGLSPIQKLESEGVSQFTLALGQEAEL